MVPPGKGALAAKLSSTDKIIWVVGKGPGFSGSPADSVSTSPAANVPLVPRAPYKRSKNGSLKKESQSEPLVFPVSKALAVASGFLLEAVSVALSAEPTAVGLY
jgi:hypothetical protein